MNRKYPAHFDEFLKLAKKHKLSYPIGRALYACNRLQMGWPRALPTKDNPYAFLSRMGELDLLKRVKEATAKHWIKHWQRGGSIRRSTMTSAQWNAERRLLDHKYRIHLRGVRRRNEQWEKEHSHEIL